MKKTYIPTIDISALYGDNLEAKLEVGKQIDAVCRKSGFFQIKNHHIKYLDKLTSEALRFFHTLSIDQKMALAAKKFNPHNSHTYRGYFPAKVNGKEGFDIGNPNLNEEHEVVKENLPMNEISVWPDESLIPKFREFFTQYYADVTDLARVLLRGFAIAAGKEEHFFDDKLKHHDCMSTVRLNYYPFLEDIEAVEIAPDGTRLGCETHRDGSLITILFQPIEGLQVEDDEVGWIDVEPSYTNFVINTGGCMSRWTNNVYQAANHRVKFINAERVSVPYFTEPHYNCVVESFTPHKPDEKPLHEPIKYGVYIAESNKQFKEYQR